MVMYDKAFRACMYNKPLIIIKMLMFFPLPELAITIVTQVFFCAYYEPDSWRRKVFIYIFLFHYDFDFNGIIYIKKRIILTEAQNQ